MRCIKRPLGWKDRGSILFVTMCTLLLLSIVGMAAIHTSTVELQISGNNQRLVEDFYVTEGALITALERTDWWLSDEFINSNAATANWVGNVDFDEDSSEDALVEIRCIDNSKSTIAALSDAANNIPADHHTAPPPVNSGYSVRHFYTLKYAATATGLRSKTKLQIGAWKVFNKY